jgi:phage shock protein A
MGIFTRFCDIINSNLNAMLDRAEDPEKLIRLMIHEMEDTLVEIKASCAGVMAGAKKIGRQLDDVKSRINYWKERAELAVSKGRDSLAREALLEKRRFLDRAEALEKEILGHNELVEQYQDDIRQLEDKLGAAREKERMLAQRHILAQKRRLAQEELRRVDSSEAIFKFEEFESRLDRMEAEADLVNFGRKPTLEDELDSLVVDEDIEKELREIKASFVKVEVKPTPV